MISRVNHRLLQVLAGILIMLMPAVTTAGTALSSTESNQTQKDGVVAKESLFSRRMDADKQVLENAFAITQYKRNYVLPFTYITNPNALGNEALTNENVDNKEAKFQLSIKLPLYTQADSIEGVYFGFTLTSFWQLYNSEVSKPFRETNYEPEVFYQWNTNIRLLGFDFNAIQLGFNHMSNGQSAERSRSWNRITLASVFSDEDDLYYLRTWYRIPEDDKTSPDDPSGDDNPRINHYFGRIELGYGTRYEDWSFFLRLRNNLELNNNRGSVEFSVSYPVSPRYEVVLLYFSGYGDSLIDYDRRQNRIGLGFQLAAF